MRTRIAIAALACSGAAGAGTVLHDVDVILEQGAEGVSTARVVSGNTTTPDRVFDADMISFFGNIATEDPGFNARLGEFAPFATMTLDIVDQLKVWDGSAFVPAASSFYLEIEFNNQVALSPASAGEVVTGPVFFVTEFGDLHNHPDHFLEVAGEPGIYLGAFRFTSGSLGDSEPFYFVYRWEPTTGDQAAAEAEQQAAIQWVRDNLLSAPCPGDLSGDGVVDATDLATLIGAWGGTDGDLDGDGMTGASDLAALIGAWGACD
jgi:hypothetical protein